MPASSYPTPSLDGSRFVDSPQGSSAPGMPSIEAGGGDGGGPTAAFGQIWQRQHRHRPRDDGSPPSAAESPSETPLSSGSGNYGNAVGGNGGGSSPILEMSKQFIESASPGSGNGDGPVIGGDGNGTKGESVETMIALGERQMRIASKAAFNLCFESEHTVLLAA